MRQKASAAFILATLLIVGGSAHGELVDNPDYATWAACKPGTTATFKVKSSRFTSIDIDADGKKTETYLDLTRTDRLVEILPEFVVISSSTALGKSKPSQTTKVILAKIDKQLIDMPGQLGLKEPKYLESTDSRETLVVNGKTIETTRHAFKVQSGTLTESIATWRAPGVPGGIVKFTAEINTKSPIIDSGELADFKLSEVAVPRPPEELDDRTPLGFMRMLDRGYLKNGDLKKSLSLIAAQTPAGKEFADATAASSIAITLLEAAVRERFGPATMLPEEIDHVIGMNGCSRSEIETASVQITGDRAMVSYGKDQFCPLIRVNGRWRLDADNVTNGMEAAEIEALVQAVRSATSFADRLTRELKAGKYATEAEFSKIMAAEMDKITPPQFKSPAP